MSTVETIPVSVDQWPEPPRLLVEWSSPWEEFKSAIRPALTKPPKQLAGEAPIGMFPYRGMLVTWVLEVLLLILVIVLPARLATLRPYTPPPVRTWGETLAGRADRRGGDGADGRPGCAPGENRGSGPPGHRGTRGW